MRSRVCVKPSTVASGVRRSWHASITRRAKYVCSVALPDMRDSRELLTHDLQASPSEVLLALSRAGVGGVQQATRIRYGEQEQRSAAGINACPCAQGLVRERAAERLGEAGFDELDVERILELVPLATHNQRGRGTLFVGTDGAVNAEELVRIVEGSMSSPVYELLKRPDELFVVEHAHLQPRFVEDSVRISLRDALAAYPELDDSDFLLSRQVNLETIHSHDVIAERYGTAGELRGELDGGEHVGRHTELRERLSSS